MIPAANVRLEHDNVRFMGISLDFVIHWGLFLKPKSHSPDRAVGTNEIRRTRRCSEDVCPQIVMIVRIDWLLWRNYSTGWNWPMATPTV